MNRLIFMCFLTALVLTTSSPAALAATTKPKAAPLPTKIPEKTTASPNNCFKAGELEQLEKYINEQRVSLPGCSKGVVKPQRIVQAYKKGKSGTAGSTKLCINVRKDAFNAEYLDMFEKDIINLTTNDTKGTNALCAANMIYYWAQNGAMTTIGQDGGNHVTASQLARVWTISGVATAYMASTNTQNSAKKQNLSSGQTKHTVILAWMKSLANQIGSEIDTDKKTADDEELGLTNRHFWRGYAILPIGILRNDINILKRSRSVFMSAMHEIEGEGEDSSGFMSEEISRKQNSLHYHVYALQPVMGMALLSKAAKCDFADTYWRKRKLSYLLRKTTEGSYNPKVFVNEVNKRAKQTVVKSVVEANGGKMMLYWGNEVDPSIFNQAKEYLVRKKVVGPELGAIGINTSFDRLGGSYRKIAKSVDAMRQNSKACPL